jgi:hypothetical protein
MPALRPTHLNGERRITIGRSLTHRHASPELQSPPINVLAAQRHDRSHAAAGPRQGILYCQRVTTREPASA